MGQSGECEPMAHAPAVRSTAAAIEQVQKSYPDCPVDCYLLFTSNSDAMSLYELAREKKIGVRVSPTPRAARATCGVSLLISCDDASTMEELAAAADIVLEGVVPLPRQIDAHRDRYC